MVEEILDFSFDREKKYGQNFHQKFPSSLCCPVRVLVFWLLLIFFFFVLFLFFVAHHASLHQPNQSNTGYFIALGAYINRCSFLFRLVHRSYHLKF